MILPYYKYYIEGITYFDIERGIVIQQEHNSKMTHRLLGKADAKTLRQYPNWRQDVNDVETAKITSRLISEEQAATFKEEAKEQQRIEAKQREIEAREAAITEQQQAELDLKKPNWKYLIERKINKQDTFTNKSEELVARAFIYYGEGSKTAGGQIKEVPQVVYIDSNDQPLTGTAHSSPPFVPTDPNKFGLVLNLIDNIGNEPNFPVPMEGLPRTFSILPFKPEAALKEGLSWNRTIYTTFGIVRDKNDLPIFPVSIRHNVRRYEIKNGRNCAVIDYTISGTHQIVDEERRQKGNYNLTGSGTAYYDPVEQIIIEKEQTISWIRSAEANFQGDNESPNWKPTGEINETVNIKISLQSEEKYNNTNDKKQN